MIDINECEENSHQCEDVNGCINSNDTYYCQCTNDNEKLASNGYRCLSKYYNNYKYYIYIAPSNVPNNVTIIAADSISLLIEWKPPNTPNGIITHNTMYINYTNDSQIATTLIDGQFNIYLLEGLIPNQLVGISLSATTAGGEGPQSDYFFNKTEKSGNM